MFDTRNFGTGRTRRAFLAVLAAALALPLLAWGSPAAAEGAQQQQQQQAQPPKQIPLTEKQIQQYIAAMKELTPLFEKMESAGDKPDPSLIVEVEKTLKKYGFTDLDDFDAVAGSIVVVMDGIDPKTKQYTDPAVSIKQAIADIQKDKSMNAAERKKAIEELNAELKEVQPVQHKGNVALVLKYYDQIVALAPQQQQQ
jgi:hypothetical protein